MLRRLIASVTAATLLATGCAASRPWPAHPVAVSTRFATGGEISTIDVLPLDLRLWAEPGYAGNLDRLRADAEGNIMSVALDTLARRNYTIGAVIDEHGNYPGGSALSREDLGATLGALARYGGSTADNPGQLPVPFLPARLGTATGSDATLYVGGWGYVPKHRESTGAKIAQGIFIGLFIVAVVAILVIADSKSSKHGNRGGSHTARGSSRSAGTITRDHRHGGLSTGAALIDAFGRTAINVALTAPDWQDDPELPREGRESEMYLEMTLIDNHTGLSLWHAHQRFPASAAKQSDLLRVAQTMLTMLPARTSPPSAAAP